MLTTSKPTTAEARHRSTAILRALARRACLFLFALTITSCTGPDDDATATARIGKTRQAFTDTDSDGMDDGFETTYFGGLSRTGTGDFDSDGILDLEEYTYGLNPTVDDGFDDADGDRYPNVFEVRRGSDPTNAGSVPTANYTVNAAGGGTHTTISAAMNAANVSNGNFQIIAIAAGTYSGTANLRDVTVPSTKPKLLFIGLDGASKTIIDGAGGASNYGWWLQNGAVVSSLTFQKSVIALYVDAPSKEVRLVDLLIRDNTGQSTWAGGVHVNAASKVQIVGSTFSNNLGTSTTHQIWFNTGAGIVTNTSVWNDTSGTNLAKNSGATLTTNYCFVKGQSLSGTGNLAGTTNPKYRPDFHLLWDSPLRAAGGTVSQSRIDFDGETRPTTSPDIGVDQFVDADSDQLSDQWELAEAGDLTTLTSRSQDADGDGLANDLEHAASTKPTVADTDGDGLSDGTEVNTQGTNPLSSDTDGDEMPDGYEVAHGLAPLVSNAFDDDDHDRYPNIYEYARSSDPSDAGSIPTANYTVDGAGGGTHTTIGAAVAAANVSNGNYQIISIVPGTYSGVANNRDVTLASTKPKLLLIGLEGASKTIIAGDLSGFGWLIQNAAVISSLTFQKQVVAHYVDAPSKEVRFVDLVVRDAIGQSTWAGGVHVNNAASVSIVGSTFSNNVGTTTTNQIWFNAGAGTVVNTAVLGSAGTNLAKASGATMTTNYSYVQGQSLIGTGNLAGTTNAKLRSDFHLLWDSPLRAAGGTVSQSRVDFDGEARPGTSPDIGVDQFVDADSDEVSDQWELAEAGDLTTLTSRSQDADGDGLANDLEHAASTKPTVADTDGDGLSDGAEVNTQGTNPLSSDTDGDEMPDGYEVAHGLAALVSNAFDDDDHDRYPNIYEYARSSDPSDAGSIPTANYTVNGAGGGTHTTIGAAVAAANVSNGNYQIVAIAQGTYSGVANNRDVTLASTKPKLLLIGLDGAEKTIINGDLSGYGWLIQNAAVISSLTFQKQVVAHYVDAPSKEVRFVDLIVRDNIGQSTWAGGVHVNNAAKVSIVGSTFVNNIGTTTTHQIWFNAGAGIVTNTAIWNDTAGTNLAKNTGATLTTNNSFARGQTLAGSGNLAGTINPGLRTNLHLRSDSPLRGAGGAVAQSRIDIDGELRPSSAPDIGVDQYVDADADGLPDAYEIETAGSTAAIAGSGDEDEDGLDNLAEYDLETDWLDPDTDGDLVLDGIEVEIGTNPLVPDSDDLGGDINGDGVIDSIGAQLGHQPTQPDSDGDGISNADEVLMCTDPLRSDTDGDGVADNTDKFPHDPLMSVLPSDPEDETAPVITLESPWYAVEQ